MGIAALAARFMVMTSIHPPYLSKGFEPVGRISRVAWQVNGNFVAAEQSTCFAQLAGGGAPCKGLLFSGAISAPTRFLPWH